MRDLGLSRTCSRERWESIVFAIEYSLAIQCLALRGLEPRCGRVARETVLSETHPQHEKVPSPNQQAYRASIDSAFQTPRWTGTLSTRCLVGRASFEDALYIW